jgi:hypothetical protein
MKVSVGATQVPPDLRSAVEHAWMDEHHFDSGRWIGRWRSRGFLVQWLPLGDAIRERACAGDVHGHTLACRRRADAGRP